MITQTVSIVTYIYIYSEMSFMSVEYCDIFGDIIVLFHFKRLGNKKTNGRNYESQDTSSKTNDTRKKHHR